jgi:molecular chaperone HtpG
MAKKSVDATNEKVNTYIPDDIVFSILSKLPLKSFKRFECVRKSWSLLFQNTHFINMFRNNLLLSNSHRCSYYDGESLLLKIYEPHQEVLYSLSGEKFENKVKLDFSNPFANQNYFHIFGFGSINGTLCIYDDECCYHILVLLNLRTNKFKVIPPSRVDLIESSIPDVAKDNISIVVLAYLQGFGYDCVTDDYKIIRYVCFVCDVYGLEEKYVDSLLGDNDISLDPLWEIYSLRSNSWRKLDVNMPYSLECTEGNQVYMDGVCHWLCEDHYESDPFRPCLVSFYLSNEVFFITPIPSDIDDCFDVGGSWINLAVLNGSITLISFHVDTTTFYISILGEIGIKESWTRLFNIGPLPYIRRPIGVGTKGEIFFTRKDKELAWFDLRTQTMEKLGYKAKNPNCRITIYKENILPIGDITL